MKKKLISITDEQAKRLEEKATTRLSQTEIVRRALDKYFKLKDK